MKEQRDLYDSGTLEEDRHILLEENGFIFEPGTNVKSTIIHEAWMRNYNELKQFKRDHGHVEVSMTVNAHKHLSNLLSFTRIALLVRSPLSTKLLVCQQGWTFG